MIVEIKKSENDPHNPICDYTRFWRFDIELIEIDSRGGKAQQTNTGVALADSDRPPFVPSLSSYSG